MPLVVIIVVIFVLAIIFETLGKILELLAHKLGPFFSLIGENIFLLAGIVCLLLAIFVWKRYQPHPAAKYLEGYQKGEISRQLAIERIADVMYEPARDGIPPAAQSKIMEKRVQALRGRVNEETRFMEDLIENLKTRSTLE